MKKVLVIEDCPLTIRVFKMLFTSHRIKVKYCDCVEKVDMDKCRKEYDLIISDYNLPGASGYEFLKDVREQKPQLPLVMVTANKKVKSECRGIENIVNELFFKPLVKDKFDHMIERYLMC